MDRIKCSRCDLVNMAADIECRRCGGVLHPKPKDHYLAESPRVAAKRSSSLYTLLALLLIGGPAVYLYSGVERSIKEVKAEETNRAATQPVPPTAELSRTQTEKKQTGQYKNAIQNSNGLAESQKHNEEIQKLMPK